VSPTSEKIKQYDALKPIRFNSMSRFEWMTIPLVRGYSQQLLLHLTTLRDDQKRSELILIFQGVRNVPFAAARLVQPLLEIRDTSGQQWEGVRYEVRDREHDTIYFLCNDFSASVREVSE
jgi:hypothetical protein